jgi:DNA polymerase III epsilon subunit family exonuclease
MSGILDRRLDDTVFTVFDFETTGMSFNYGDKIVEFAFVKYSYKDGVIEQISSKVNPQRRIPIDASLVHGIYDRDVAEAPLIDSFIQEIAEFIEGTVLVGHNVYFDLRFLEGEMERSCVDVENPYLCTMGFPGFLGEKTQRRLGDICAEKGISLINAHSALDDTLATVKLLESQIKDAMATGLTTFRDLGSLKKSYKFISSWRRCLD